MLFVFSSADKLKVSHRRVCSVVISRLNHDECYTLKMNTTRYCRYSVKIWKIGTRVAGSKSSPLIPSLKNATLNINARYGVESGLRPGANPKRIYRRFRYEYLIEIPFNGFLAATAHGSNKFFINVYSIGSKVEGLSKNETRNTRSTPITYRRRFNVPWIWQHFPFVVSISMLPFFPSFLFNLVITSE